MKRNLEILLVTLLAKCLCRVALDRAKSATVCIMSALRVTSLHVGGFNPPNLIPRQIFWLYSR